jgi:GT2 family glycosyltransferase
MDERFFMYCEEPDLCLRMKRAGWSVRHLPMMTVRHPFGRAGWNPRLVAQDAYARRQYAAKHFSGIRRAAVLAAFALGHMIRTAYSPGTREERRARRRASVEALRTLAGLKAPPFGEPPTQAVAPWDGGAASDSAAGRR